MSIRTCPDCRGKGLVFFPVSQRTQIEYTECPWVSNTAVSIRERTLPATATCRLCAGSGKVNCVAVKGGG